MASPVVQRFPGLDQTTRWVPDRSFVSTSRVVLNVRNVRFHKDGLVVVGLVAVIIGLQIGGRVLALTKSSDDIGLVLACLMGWSISVLPFHHELAHATVARREGIEVVAAGYSAGRAYVLLQAPSTGVTVRAWTRTLVAGVVSNGVIALAAFAWWLGRGGAKVDPTGAFLLGGLCDGAVDGDRELSSRDQQRWSSAPPGPSNCTLTSRFLNLDSFRAVAPTPEQGTR